MWEYYKSVNKSRLVCETDLLTMNDSSDCPILEVPQLSITTTRSLRETQESPLCSEDTFDLLMTQNIHEK